MRVHLWTLGGAVLGSVAAIFIGIATFTVGAYRMAAAELQPSDIRGADPSPKATRLGQTISEAMNTSALAALLLTPAGAYLGRRRGQRSSAP